MPTKSYPVHTPAEVAIPNFRESFESVYVVSHDNGKLFNLKDLTMTDETLPEECDAGWVVKINPDGTYEDFELDEATKSQLTDDPMVIECLNQLVVNYCTGKTVYNVAWWAMEFNTFMEGFCNRHFEV